MLNLLLYQVLVQTRVLYTPILRGRLSTGGELSGLYVLISCDVGYAILMMKSAKHPNHAHRNSSPLRRNFLSAGFHHTQADIMNCYNILVLAQSNDLSFLVKI